MRKPAAMLATTFLATGLLALVPPSYAEPDTAPNAVTITTTSTVDWWDRIETQVDWCDGQAKAGDELVVELPRQLTGFRPDFSAADEQGDSLASATIDGNTLRIRIDETLGKGTCAIAHLESVLVDGRSARDSHLDLDFRVDGQVIQNRVDVRPWKEGARKEANAWGEFRDQDDQCRTSGRSCLLWHWDTMAGPFSGGVLSGRPAAGQEFACADVTIDLVRLGEHGEVTGTTEGDGQVTCTPDELRVALDAVPAGTLARVNVPASTSPVAVGGVTFRTEFVARDSAHTSIATDQLTSTTATLSARSAPDDGQRSRPEEMQGAWPFLAIGALLAAGLVAVAVRRRSGS